MKKYTSIIKVEFVGNAYWAENEQEYKEKVRYAFQHEFNICPSDNEIEILTEEEVEGS